MAKRDEPISILLTMADRRPFIRELELESDPLTMSSASGRWISKDKGSIPAVVQRYIRSNF